MSCLSCWAILGLIILYLNAKIILLNLVGKTIISKLLKISSMFGYERGMICMCLKSFVKMSKWNCSGCFLLKYFDIFSIKFNSIDQNLFVKQICLVFLLVRNENYFKSSDNKPSLQPFCSQMVDDVVVMLIPKFVFSYFYITVSQSADLVI
jgi:hypothetical protein